MKLLLCCIWKIRNYEIKPSFSTFKEFIGEIEIRMSSQPAMKTSSRRIWASSGKILVQLDIIKIILSMFDRIPYMTS